MTTLKETVRKVCMVLLDLQKAFDTLDHDILCNKLKAMGVADTKADTEWFHSYLTNRTQLVNVNGFRPVCYHWCHW